MHLVSAIMPQAAAAAEDTQPPSAENQSRPAVAADDARQTDTHAEAGAGQQAAAESDADDPHDGNAGVPVAIVLDPASAADLIALAQQISQQQAQVRPACCQGILPRSACDQFVPRYRITGAHDSAKCDALWVFHLTLDVRCRTQQMPMTRKQIQREVLAGLSTCRQQQLAPGACGSSLRSVPDMPPLLS